MTTYTPMIQQYLQIKSQHEDAFLFFRLGDFYEMFFDDAIQASQLLEITLTSRDAGGADRIPMCGVPYHSAIGYIETLVGKGYKVAICEQTEDPKLVKGLVKREVVKMITPGTMLEGKSIDTNTNHYIGAVAETIDQRYCLAYVDLATGEGKAELIEGKERTLIAEIEALNMKEMIVGEQLHIALNEALGKRGILLSVELGRYEHDEWYHQLPTEAVECCSMLIAYLDRTQNTSLDHMRPFQFVEKHSKLSIDANSMRNLELVQSIRSGGKEGTLFWLLDETVTAMGARMLKRWIHQPLADQKAIEQRVNTVEAYINDYFLRQQLQDHLKEVYDLERLAGRISMGSASGRDLAQLRNSLRNVPALKEQLLQNENPLLQQLAHRMDDCQDIRSLLEASIAENPPLSVKDPGIIKDGYHQQLDAYRNASRHGKEWLATLEQEERERTGIKSLKIGYNRIFGYYIEITKANIHLADLSRYERKQTLANAERYITPELKEKEDLILNAEAESLELEYKLFVDIREKMRQYIRQVQQLATVLSEVDIYLSLATVAENQHFVKPQFHEGRALDIRNGRHPVVEKMMDHSLYVPNSCKLTETKNMYLITGPNMSGKSTFMRQVALTVVMAQLGSFVPCEYALLPITDQIFTRIGAADDVASGQSTFMMEMMESRNAIINATEKSLLLFDEIGRGTSTYDGMALAQAMMEYIHDQIGANTLFSTHYHELTKLEDVLPRLENVHVAAMEQEGKVVFLHKVMSGAADKSYGIYVAELAGLPSEVLERAKDLLVNLEMPVAKSPSKEKEVAEQLALFDVDWEQPAPNEQLQKQIIEPLEQLDILHTTPMQAFQLLHELKEKLISLKG